MVARHKTAWWDDVGYHTKTKRHSNYNSYISPHLSNKVSGKLISYKYCRQIKNEESIVKALNVLFW